MTKKNRLIYKIITIITLAVPLPLYLFLSATLFNITADIEIKHVTSADIVIVDDFGYTNNQDAIYSGVTVYENGQYGFFVDEETIIKVDDGYFSYIDNELMDIKKLSLQKEMSYKIPIAFMISALGVGIVFLVIQKKMELYKKYPRMSALIALTTGTLVLLVINTIVSSLLGVFMIATISWAIYCLEYMTKENFISSEDGKKTESDLLNSLKKALGK